MKMNKKAMTWQQIVLALIAIIVVTFVIIWFKGGGEKAFGGLSDKISSLKDCDKDNVADMFDKCPCDAATKENKEAAGCPDTQKEDKTGRTIVNKCCVDGRYDKK